MASNVPDHINSLVIDMTDAGQRRPILAIEAARIFAKWANVEYALATMASVLIGDSTALLLLDQLKAKNQQLEAVRIAASEKIEDAETRDFLKPLFKLINKAAEPRNQLAHCLWGTIDELPDALLLTEPKAAVKASRMLLKTRGNSETTAAKTTDASFQHSFNGHSDRALEIIKILRDGTKVWSHQDFNTPLLLLDKAIFCLTCYTTAVSSTPDNQGAKQALQQVRNALKDAERYY